MTNTIALLQESIDAILDGSSQSLVVKEQMEGIAFSVHEQQTAIDAISHSIQSIADVVETNAAASEETAAISTELINRANELEEMVHKFKL